MIQGFPFKLATVESGLMRSAQSRSSVTKLSLAVKLALLTLKWTLGAQIVFTCKRSFAFFLIWGGKTLMPMKFILRQTWLVLPCTLNARYFVHANHFQPMARVCWPTKPRRKVFIPSTENLDNDVFLFRCFGKSDNGTFVCAFLVCPLWICNEHGFVIIMGL